MMCRLVGVLVRGPSGLVVRVDARFFDVIGCRGSSGDDEGWRLAVECMVADEAVAGLVSRIAKPILSIFSSRLQMMVTASLMAWSLFSSSFTSSSLISRNSPFSVSNAFIFSSTASIFSSLAFRLFVRLRLWNRSSLRLKFSLLSFEMY